MSRSARTIIYREYISNHLPITVNPEYKVVDLIIGFAREDYNPKGEGTGRFRPTWNLVAISPEKVKNLKEKYPQVRVVISIGGAGTQYSFNPADIGRWSGAAAKFVKEIIQIYGNLIDGIDIHYDVIKWSPDDFSKSIGEVIERLKNDPHLTIKVVSIAPNEDFQWHYRKLLSEYHNYIDFVDYLFTANLKIDDVEEFYAERVAQYKPIPVLPGYLSTTISGDKSKEAVEYLVNHKIAPGYFTYGSSAIPRTDIYREYILKGLPTTVSLEYKVVDLIIGFASEDYNPKGEGTGHFHPSWNIVAFSPVKVNKLKKKYPQVRVVISIGGAGIQYAFNPADKDRWSRAAAKSVKELIQIYGNLIDGIDIHYDVIKSSSDEFSKSIGEVIKKLKNDPHLNIKVVSIAPNEETQWHYRKLVSEYHNYINFVDFLFTKPIADVEEFYDAQVDEYNPIPVLPGYLSPTLPGDKSKEVVEYLVNHKIAPGFFIYPSAHEE